MAYLDNGGVTHLWRKIKNAISHGAPAHNLLDNSDFLIAQAEYGGAHGTTIYPADRWMQNDTTARTYSCVTQNGHGALKCASATRIQQKIELASGVTYTAAVYINDTLNVRTFTANGGEYGSGALWVNHQSDGTYMFIVSNIPSGGTVSEPVLYQGSYTAETLPPYVPKGYAPEFMECRRYYQKTIPAVLYCYADSYLFPFVMETPMHRVPTYGIVSAYTAVWDKISGDITVSDVTNYGVGVFQNASFKAGNYYRLFIEVNADL